MTVPLLCLFSCGQQAEQPTTATTTDRSTTATSWSVPLRELSDEEYPNNPDMAIRHSQYPQVAYASVQLLQSDTNRFSITIVPEAHTDTITLAEVDFREWIPTACTRVQSNAYLSYIAIVNQEWNRQQVRFDGGEFAVAGANPQRIKRVDIARNCLNAYLWEVILFAEEDSLLKPYYHGWFDFPSDLYARLFEQRNDVAYATYREPLENWTTPEHLPVDLSSLRTATRAFTVPFENLNHEAYPLKGERKKKLKNILFPKNTRVIRDFLTDSTVFATFSPPGFYDQSDPRSTQLSRLRQLDSVQLRSLDDGLFEIELQFNTSDPEKATHFIVSGLDDRELPVLPAQDAHRGWQNSMGFGNHSFYESYQHALAKSSLHSPYFAVLTDRNDNWLDSHEIGIDGPLLHWDDQHSHLLHCWILSFERHAFVGHYTIDCSEIRAAS